MFFVYLTALSTALVLSITLLVLHYGEPLIRDGKASVKVVGVINDAKHVLFAARLYQAKTSVWPTELSALVSEGFLKQLPGMVDPAGVANPFDSGPATSAVAEVPATVAASAGAGAGAPTTTSAPATAGSDPSLPNLPAFPGLTAAPTAWTQPVKGSPVFSSPLGAYPELCARINQQARGQKTVSVALLPGQSIQCVGTPAAGYVLVVNAGNAQDLTTFATAAHLSISEEAAPGASASSTAP